MRKSVLITGGAGYIGSLLIGLLLNRQWQVVVLDNLMFGGEALLPYFTHKNFRFVKGDICDRGAVVDCLEGVDNVVHLAAIVGFPACQQVGEKLVWEKNVKGTQNVFELCADKGVGRFVFASTYSNYGLGKDGQPVDEDSPLFPQSLYARTKIASEQYLFERAASTTCAPIVLRFATLFGISPRTRFDLIINQFVLEALTHRELIIYQQNYSRTFVHVRDAAKAICLGLTAPEGQVRGQIYNVGSEAGNYSKHEIATMVQQYIPECKVIYHDQSFGGDMRDIRVSFAKIQRQLGFKPKIGVEQGIIEVRDAIQSGLIKEPLSSRYRNADFIIQ